MYQIRIVTKEIPEKEARRNVIIVVAWLFLVILTFLLAMGISYVLLIPALIELIAIAPITIIISKVSKKHAVEVIKTKDVTAKDHMLYCEDRVFHVKYDETEDTVSLFHVYLHPKYRQNILDLTYTLVQEDNASFLEFCRMYHVEINEKIQYL